jgi:hypothetical protein
MLSESLTLALALGTSAPTSSEFTTGALASLYPRFCMMLLTRCFYRCATATSFQFTAETPSVACKVGLARALFKHSSSVTWLPRNRGQACFAGRRLLPFNNRLTTNYHIMQSCLSLAALFTRGPPVRGICRRLQCRFGDDVPCNRPRHLLVSMLQHL